MKHSPTVERRVRRSDRADLALLMQLEQTRSTGNLEAVVLVDSQGVLLAHAGDRRTCDALGALAPLGPWARSSGVMAELVGGRDVAVRPLRLNGSPLYLAALGGTSARDAVLAHALSGVTRILVAN